MYWFNQLGRGNTASNDMGRFKSKSSGLWCHVVLWYDTNVSDGFTAFIFMVK